MHRTRFLPLIALALLVVCSRGEERVETKPVPRPRLVDGIYAVAEVRATAAPLPGKFTQDLPTTVADFKARWPRYPQAHIRKQLCADDAEMTARFERAAIAAARSGASGDELRATFGTLLEGCAPTCAWALAAMSEAGPKREVAWGALAACGPSAERWFATSDAPAELIIDYWSNRSYAGDDQPRFSPALATAFKAIATRGDRSRMRRAAFLVAETNDPHAAQLLVETHRGLSPGDVRDDLARAMRDVRHPAAPAIFREYCSRPGNGDPICSSDRVAAADIPDESAKTSCVDPALRASLADEDSGEAYEVNDCLQTVAKRNRAAAVADAKVLSSWTLSNAELRRTVSFLTRFPEEGQLASKLSSLGLLRGAQNDPSALTPVEMLISSKSVTCFDVETGTYPNGHDALLYDLAALAGEPFTRAAFDESAPPVEADEGVWLLGNEEVRQLPAGVAPGDPYRLTAYLDGRAYAADAQDFGDWYDLDQVLGLLNAIAIDQKSELRFATLAGGGQEACVIAAPARAIAAAMKEGLLEFESPGDAMKEGKRVEEEVLKQLQRGQEP